MGSVGKRSFLGSQMPPVIKRSRGACRGVHGSSFDVASSGEYLVPADWRPSGWPRFSVPLRRGDGPRRAFQLLPLGGTLIFPFPSDF